VSTTGRWSGADREEAADGRQRLRGEIEEWYGQLQDVIERPGRAPNMSRNGTHRHIQMSKILGVVSLPPAKMARKPVSSSSDSHPKA
jgi:hypothetical protein